MVAPVDGSSSFVFPQGALGRSQADRTSDAKLAVAAVTQANSNWAPLRTQASLADLHRLSGALTALLLYPNNPGATVAQANDITRQIKTIARNYAAAHPNATTATPATGDPVVSKLRNLLGLLGVAIASTGNGNRPAGGDAFTPKVPLDLSA